MFLFFSLDEHETEEASGRGPEWNVSACVDHGMTAVNWSPPLRVWLSPQERLVLLLLDR